MKSSSVNPGTKFSNLSKENTSQQFQMIHKIDANKLDDSADCIALREEANSSQNSFFGERKLSDNWVKSSDDEENQACSVKSCQDTPSKFDQISEGDKKVVPQSP
jgi:hypothetical protein